MGYTTSDAFFEALWDAGITHCFVNLGTDHPSIIEAIVKGEKERKDRFPRIITCPNEMVALSMADGYARWTGEPQCVIVHVDVGTQGLAAAVHNASTGRAPVLIFAGLSPCTLEGEARGSRTEFIHWIQDVPDQKQIVAQYCRYTGEVKVGQNIKQLVNRALSFAMSDPKGPVYLCGAREILEQEIKPYQINQNFWSPVGPGALPEDAVKTIAESLVKAKNPLLITGYSGRNHIVPLELVKLTTKIPHLRVLDTGGSDMCFPANNPSWLGLRYGVDDSIKKADVILVLDCDVPWVNTRCKPRNDAVIYHVDVDPLKQQIPVFYIDAQGRWRADSEIAISQILKHIQDSQLKNSSADAQRQIMIKEHQDRLELLEQVRPLENGQYEADFLCNQLRKFCPKDTIWCIEAVTSTLFAADQLQANLPGSWLNCGGGGLGWSGGGSLGVKLATQKKGTNQFVCQIVGDGTYLFCVPGSVYWIARRYNIPTLTIVLNNHGWKAPKNSLLLVHPDGYGSKVSDADLHVEFSPTPDYAGIAQAAAGGPDHLWAARVGDAAELVKIIPQAVEKVQSGIPVVIDAHLHGSVGKVLK